jgi:hypothetical protein
MLQPFTMDVDVNNTTETDMEAIAVTPTAVATAAYIVRHMPLGDGRTVYDLLVHAESRHALDVCDAYGRGEATEQDIEREMKAIGLLDGGDYHMQRTAAMAVEYAVAGEVDSAAWVAAGAVAVAKWVAEKPAARRAGMLVALPPDADALAWTKGYIESL